MISLRVWGITWLCFIKYFCCRLWANCMLTSIINMTAVRTRTLQVWQGLGSWWLCYNIYLLTTRDLFSPTQHSNRISDKEELQLATANHSLYCIVSPNYKFLGQNLSFSIIAETELRCLVALYLSLQECLCSISDHGPSLLLSNEVLHGFQLKGDGQESSVKCIMFLKLKLRIW